MGYQFNVFTGTLDATGSAPDLTGYALLAGRSGGQDLKGGLTSSENLLLRANAATFDNLDTGRIEIKNQMVWDDAVTVNATFDGFLFTVGNFSILKNTGIFTLSPTMNAGNLSAVASQSTIRYSSTQIITSAPVFQSSNTIQPTAAVNDNPVAFWTSFAAIDAFSPDLSTAITATTANFYGYVASPRANMKVGSHASAAGVVTNLTGFDAWHAIGNHVDSQMTATTARGFHAHNPVKAGSGAIGTLVGLDIDAQTAGTNNIGIRVAKASTYSIHLTNVDGTAAGGITFGADTNLYRSSANTLKTDDNLIALAASSTVAGSVLTVDGAGIQAQIMRRLSIGF